MISAYSKSLFEALVSSLSSDIKVLYRLLLFVIECRDSEREFALVFCRIIIVNSLSSVGSTIVGITAEE